MSTITTKDGARQPPTLFVARVCLTLPYWAGGLVKLFAWDEGVAKMANSGLRPAWVFNVATLATEFGGAALVVLNFKTWLGAGALGVFTVLASSLDTASGSSAAPSAP